MVVLRLKFACGGFIRASDLALVIVAFHTRCCLCRLQRRSPRRDTYARSNLAIKLLGSDVMQCNPALMCLLGAPCLGSRATRRT